MICIQSGKTFESFRIEILRRYHEQEKQNEDQGKIITEMQKTIAEQKDLIQMMAVHPELRRILQGFKTAATSKEVLGEQ